MSEPRRRTLSTTVLPVLGAGLALAAWWSATELFDIQTILVPKPPEVYAAFRRLQGYLLDMSRVTLTETLVGFAIAVALGLLIAIVLATSRIAERMFYPLLVGLNAVPKLAVAPLFVVWLGIDMKPKITMVVLLCFFPIVISTAAGLTSTPAELVEYARSLDTPRWRIFLKVRFPYALPQVFVGLKVAITLAVIGAVVGELVGGDKGLGFVIQSAGSTSDTPLAFAAIILLGIMGVALFYLLAGLERLAVPWARETTAR